MIVTIETQSGIQPSTYSCGVSDCYSKCRQADIARTVTCRKMNEDHMKRMRANGCKGAACSMPSMGKTCTKPKTVKKAARQSQSQNLKRHVLKQVKLLDQRSVQKQHAAAVKHRVYLTVTNS
jgi:hypothetical protein